MSGDIVCVGSVGFVLQVLAVWFDGVVAGILAACEGSIWSKATLLTIAVGVLCCSIVTEMVRNDVIFFTLNATR